MTAAEGAAAAAGRTLGQALLSSVARRPNHVALAGAGGELTFAQLDVAVNRLANALAGLGVRRGERVAVLSENRLEYGVAFYACARLGAMVAALNWRLAAPELEAAIRLARPRVVMVSARHRPLFELVRSSLGSLERVVLLDERPERGGDASYSSLMAAASTSDPGVAVHPEDVVSLIYTSGTTGTPKAAMISQRAILARAMVMAADMGLHQDEAFVSWSPMFHMVSTDYLMIMGVLGGTCVIVPGFDVARLADILHRRPVGWLPAMPGALEPLLDEIRGTGKRPLRLRLIGAMADLIPPSLIAEATTVVGAPFFNSFGSTEAGTLPSSGSTIPIGEAPARLSKRQSAFCDVRLVDRDDRPVPAGTPGEMLLRAPTMFSGYLDDEEASGRTFRGGWFHTGDVMVRNPDGTLDFLDRRKYMIKSAGENIYPAELERVLRRHPAVTEAVVVGGRDDRWGEVPWACVAVTDPGVGEAELIAFCEGRVARYKRPRHVRFMDPSDFPRNETGKVLRHELERKLFG